MQVRSRNVEAVGGIADAWNRRDFEACLAPLDDHCIFTDHGRGITLKTHREILDVWFKGWYEGFPDGEITDLRFSDAGNTVIVQFVGRGTHTGHLGPLPPTGKEVVLPLCEVYHFGENGKIVAAESYYDQITLLAQLGIVEPPGG